MEELERTERKIDFDWNQAFHTFKDIIDNGIETSKLRATVKLSRLLDCAPKDLLSSTVPILIRLLESSSPLIQEAASYCLKCMACNDDGRLAVLICKASTIASLLRMLQLSDGCCQKHLVKCLWGLVTYVSDSRFHVFTNDGLEVVLNLLASCDSSSRLYLLEILSALAMVRAVRRGLFILGQLRALVEAAKYGSMVSRERAAQAIGLLGVIRKARLSLVMSGAIPALVDLLRDGNISTKIVAGNALGVISSHFGYIRPIAEAGAIPLFAELLRAPEPMCKEIAEDVFCILAVAETNAVEIVEHLIRILREDDVEAKATAADILWDLSSYKHLVSFIRNSGAIPILVDLLRDGSIDVRQRVSGAIAQLSCNETNRLALADAGAILALMGMLQDESEELRDNAAEALINFSEDPTQRGRISQALDMPAIQSMQNRLVHIRAADQHMARSLRYMSIAQHLTGDPVLD
ncbi:hypothetical protein Ancab_002812 [Ancistrocladus abbreviatus]